MLVRLELETRAYHAPAEAGWRDLMMPEVTRGQYVDQLVRVYGFEGPLEAALAYTPHLELVIDVHQRFRAGFIAQDLIALGMRPSEVARLDQCVLAPFASPLEALGWIYATDRATLVFEDLRRYLRVRVPLTRDACAYLEASERVGGSRWLELGRQLERAVRSPRMADEVIAGAHAAFRCWLAWSRGRAAGAAQQLG
jgi:heme oxygenase